MALPYYKAYPRDFIEGTIGMSLELKGAYRLVIDLIYMQGGNLPDDDRYISGLLGCTVRKWKSLRSELIDRDKLQVNGEFLTNYRAANELETLGKLQEKQRLNGSKPKKNNGLPQAMAKQTRDYPEPEPITKEETIVSLKENPSPDPEPPPKSKRKPAAKRLPDGWQPSPDLIAFAKSEGLSESEISRETDRFRDYWRAKGAGGQKADWDATWRNWLRKFADDRPKSGGQRVAGSTNAGSSRSGNGLVGAYVRSEVARRETDPVSG